MGEVAYEKAFAKLQVIVSHFTCLLSQYGGKSGMINKWNRRQVLLVICAAVISAFVVMTWKVYPIAIEKNRFLEYSIRFSFREDWKAWLIAVIFAGLAVKYLFAFVTKTSVIREADKDFVQKQKRLFWVSFILNCMSWGSVFLLFFPGATLNDTINCMMSPVEASGMQPLIFELIVYWGLWILERLTGNMFLAYAVLTFGQMLFCAFAAAYAIAWIYGKKLKLPICYVLALFFAFSPIMADYSITLIKDSCFAFFFLLLLLQVYDLMSEKDKVMTNGQIVKLTVLMTFVTLFRANGIIVTAFLLFVLFMFKRMDRKKILAVILAVISISRLNGAVVSHYNQESVTLREASGVLIQQIAAVVAKDGNVSEKELEFLDHIFPIEQWRNCYSFSFVDAIKFNGDFDNHFLNEHKSEFIKTWFSLLKKNFKIFVDAFFFHTYQLWNIASFDRSCVDYSQSIYTKINNNIEDGSIWAEFLESVGLRNKSVYPEMIVNPLSDTFFKECELGLMISPGWMAMIFIICIFFLWIKECWVELVFLFSPLLMWIFFMALTPAAGPYRYSLYMLVTLPFGIMIAWIGINKNGGRGSSAGTSGS